MVIKAKDMNFSDLSDLVVRLGVREIKGCSFDKDKNQITLMWRYGELYDRMTINCYESTPSQILCLFISRMGRHNPIDRAGRVIDDMVDGLSLKDGTSISFESGI